MNYKILLILRVVCRTIDKQMGYKGVINVAINVGWSIDATIFQIQHKSSMKNPKKLLILALLFAATLSVQQYYSDYKQAFAGKKGMTFEATVWPEQKNSFVGRMSCNGCNPNEGDTYCTVKLPITCIVNYMKLDRPYYSYYPTTSLQNTSSNASPFSNADQSFYEGWTGGVIALTDPIRGLEIDSYLTGTRLCQNAFGADAKFATFTDGLYIDRMNGPVIKIEKSWSWAQTKRGQYNFWGVFNHNHVGRSWVWTQTTPTGNCIIPKANPIPTN